MVAIGWCASAHAATVYKWVDAQGKTHFSDKAPPEHAQQQASTLELKGEVARDPEMEQYRKRSQALLQAAEADRAEQAKQAAERAQQAQQREARRRQCVEAKDKQREVAEASSVYDLDERGERVFLGDGDRSAYEQELARWIKQNCD